MCHRVSITCAITSSWESLVELVPECHKVMKVAVMITRTLPCSSHDSTISVPTLRFFFRPYTIPAAHPLAPHHYEQDNVEFTGYWHQRADGRHDNPPQGNQELLVVKDKVGRPPGGLGVNKSMECDVFP